QVDAAAQEHSPRRQIKLLNELIKAVDFDLSKIKLASDYALHVLEGFQEFQVSSSLKSALLYLEQHETLPVLERECIQAARRWVQTFETDGIRRQTKQEIEANVEYNETLKAARHA